MKKIYAGILLVLLFMSGTLLAQLQINKADSYKVKLDTLTIAYSKTTNIVFPFAVKSVDRGSKEILVQRVKGFENILQIKAANYGFDETNLTAVTSDGQLYSFVLHYNEQTPILNRVIDSTKMAVNENFISDESINDAELISYAKLSFYKKKKLYGVSNQQFDMKLQLNGLFIHDQVMYYRILMENHSNVNYNISQLRFFIRDQKKSKRTASQEIELYPLYVFNNTDTIQGKSEICLVYAISKFTIPDKKYLAIQLMEDNGGRHLELRVKNRKLKKIEVLPVL